MNGINISLREKEVLQCLAEGLTTRQIAKRLYVSFETIKTHRNNLLRKLNAKNAFQLGKYSMEYNLLQEEPVS